MIFGKDKKTSFTNPLSRPLESAALGRWRTLNESTQASAGEESGKNQAADHINDSKPRPFHGLEEAEDFIQEQIPLISLNNPITESDQEDFHEEPLLTDPAQLSLEEDLDNPGSYEQYEADDSDSHSDIYQPDDQEAEYADLSEHDLSEQELLPPIVSQPMLTPPLQPTREKTLVGDFGISAQDDIKNRFGSDLKSALGHGTVIEGMFSFENPVKIDGSLKGEIRSSSALIVGPEAQVNARIKVGTLIVLGSVQGEIEAEDLIEVRSTGCLDGDLVTRRFALEEGGIFNGACTMIE